LSRSLALAAVVLAALTLTAGPAFAETRRLAIVVGSNAGSGEQPALRFAESDATKIASVLTELGGIAPDDVLLLQGRSLAALREALDLAARRVAAWRRTADTHVVLLFYFSGHSDGQALEIGRERYLFGELRRWLAGTGADVRLAIVDSCKSGALLGVKGGMRAPPFEIRLVSDVESSGEVLLTSSAADETALESREIRGSFFSHHLVSGLRGAADSSGDGQVTLAEAYQYAFAHTVSATANTLPGPQHPAFDYRLSGQGELVLTQLSRPSAVIEVPPGFDRLLVVQARRDQVIAELVAGSARRLAVEPGGYALRAWRDGKTYAAVLVVAANESRSVRADELQATTAPMVAAKGDVPPAGESAVDRPQLLVAGGAERGIASQLGALGSLRVSLRTARGPRAALELATGRGPDFRETHADLLAGLGLTRGRGRLRASAGLEVGGGLMMQAPDGRASRWSGAGVAAVVGGGALRLDGRLWLALEGWAPLVLVRRDDRTTAVFLPAAWLGVIVDL
jgi:Caspase domain